MKLVYCLCFFLLLFEIQSIDASAFVKKPGEVFHSSQYWSYGTKRYWDKHGKERFAGNIFNKYQWNNYFEAGITPTDTITAKFLYDKITETVHPNTYGFEDPEFSWRHEHWHRKIHRLSSEIILIVPAGYTVKPSLRYSRFALQYSFYWGGGFKFKKRDAFFDFGLGYRHYFGFPSDQVRSEFATGVFVTPKFQPIFIATMEYGVFNGKPRVGFQNSILQEANYRLFKLYGILRYKLTEEISATLGYYRHVWGQNTGTGGGFILGFWYNFEVYGHCSPKSP